MNTLNNVSNNNSQKIHFANTHDLDEYVSDSGMLFKSRQHHNTATYEDYITIDPRNALATNAFSTNGVNTEVYVDDPKIDKVRALFVEYDLTNNHTGAITLLPSEFCLEYVEFFIGEQSLGQVKNLALYISNKCLLDFDEMTAISADEFVSPTTFSSLSSTVAAAATVKVRVNVTSILRGMGLNIYALNSTGKKLKLKFSFRQASDWITGLSTGTVSVNNFKLIVEHTKYLREIDREQERGRYLAGPVAIRILDIRNLTEPKTHSANTETYIDISALSGLSSCIFIGIRAVNPTGTALTTFKTATDIFIQDGADNVFSQKLKGDYLRRRAYKYFAGTRLFSTLNIYPLPFAEHQQQTLMEGINSGLFSVTNNHKLYYTPAAAASDQVDVVSISYNYLIISGTNITFAKST